MAARPKSMKASDLQRRLETLRREMDEVQAAIRRAQEGAVDRLLMELRGVVGEFARRHFEAGADTDLTLSKRTVDAVKAALLTSMPVVTQPGKDAGRKVGEDALVAPVGAGGLTAAGGIAAASTPPQSRPILDQSNATVDAVAAGGVSDPSVGV